MVSPWRGLNYEAQDVTYEATDHAPYLDGWKNHGSLLIAALKDLSDEQLNLRTAPHQWAIWQLAAHIAGTRTYWLDLIDGCSDELRDFFGVAFTTVPGLPLEDAGWEDDEDQPRNAAGLVDALTRTWQMVEERRHGWSPDELRMEFHRSRGRVRRFSRHWVIWHLMEHEIHHGGEISQILGTHGLTPVDL